MLTNGSPQTTASGLQGCAVQARRDGIAGGRSWCSQVGENIALYLVADGIRRLPAFSYFHQRQQSVVLLLGTCGRKCLRSSSAPCGHVPFVRKRRAVCQYYGQCCAHDPAPTRINATYQGERSQHHNKKRCLRSVHAAAHVIRGGSRRALADVLVNENSFGQFRSLCLIRASSTTTDPGSNTAMRIRCWRAVASDHS